ncbi:MAG: di-trans,poly-cis-decaprenylcistransferase [Betaproteobacteria bacterium]|nr:di-trans,poly-cis-decaprenylcistransferase [Betaproteobacteria bacterium]
MPSSDRIPRHIAIIMDGNGRWAKQRHLPRVAGHKRGVETVREIIKASANSGVEYLTLFAFSSENWRRPVEEVSMLRQLFALALQQEVEKLNRNDIRLKVIGELAPFGEQILEQVRRAEELTSANKRLTLTVAANYGGRWDLLEGVEKMLKEHPDRSSGFSEEELAPHLAMSFAPDPDLFIRTGGEQRISNFILWHLAYTELYFTDCLWPDFDAKALGVALGWYQQRERRFGRTSEQLAGSQTEVTTPDKAMRRRA